jgi:two-component system NtrC family response regulator
MTAETTGETVRSKVLVVDDEQAICWAFQQVLAPHGYTVLAASSAEEGLEVAARERPDLCLLDIRLPGLSGLDALPRFRELLPEMPVLVMTAHGTMETAIEAIKRGACNYLIKPIHSEEARHQIRTALQTCRLSREVARLRQELQGAWSLDSLVGKSPAMQEVYKKIGSIAGSDCSVLIYGESGTGKELVARALHHYSARAKGPFIAVNCASLPEPLLESELYGHVKGAFTGAIRDKAGKAEAADGGTLLLDEIGEMPPAIQAKLLRFLEQKRFERVGSTESLEVDARILASTNRNLQERMAKNLFRQDLYFRLNVVSLELPPLRERKDDLPLLVARFLSPAGEGPAKEISQEALKLLERYDWPGNVRELKNAVEHAVLLARGQPVQPEHLPAHILQALRGETPAGAQSLEDLVRSRVLRGLDEAESRGEGNVFNEVLSDVEKAVMDAAMKRVDGNQVRASALLGMHRTTLRKKLEEHGIQ